MHADVLKLLEPMHKFPSDAPRYPNLWFLVSEQVLKAHAFDRSARIESTDALRVALRMLETTMEVESNTWIECSEGCGFVTKRRGLALCEMGEKTHDHETHYRFYMTQVDGVRYEVDGKIYYPCPCSVHFEVDRPGRLHPYIDDCPICGCCGPYAQFDQPAYRDRSSNLKNEMVHDPMGLEATLFGTVCGRKIPLIRGLDSLGGTFALDIQVFEKRQLREDMNTSRLGVVRVDLQQA